MEPGHSILAVLPFFHIYGLTALMNVPLRCGATVVVLPRFDLDQFLGAIQEHRISGLYVAPPIVLALAKHPAVGTYDLSSIEYIVSAAAPWTPSSPKPAPTAWECRPYGRRTA